MTSPRRDVALDHLRLAALALVMFRHLPLLPEEAGRLGWLAEPLRRFGWTGVDLFFVLSGYLVGGLIFREISRTGGFRPGHFAMRRAWKILPSYLIFLGISAAWLRLRGVPETFSRELMFLHNYRGTSIPHLWSLAVEVHFYALAAVVLAVLPRRLEGGRVVAIPAVVPLALGVGAACLALRLAGAGGSFDMFAHLTPTHLRLDSLASGVLLAYLATFRPGPLDALAARRGWLALASLALLAPMAALDLESSRFVSTWGFTLLYLGYGGLLVATAWHPGAPPATPGRAASALATLGAASYATYLWHARAGIDAARLVVIPATAGWAPELRWLLVAATAFGLSLAAGLAFGALDARLVASRDRLLPRRSD